MKGPLFLLVLSQLAHPLHVGSGGGTRGAVETQSGGTLLYHAIFSNAVVSSSSAAYTRSQPAFCMLTFLIVCIVRRSTRLLFSTSLSFQRQEYFPDYEATPSLPTSSTPPSPSAPWSSPPSSLLSLERAEYFTMSHPCSLAAWRNTGMHGGAAVAKAVVSHHSLTMVRPAAVLDHSMRPRNKSSAAWKEYMRAGSFSRFRNMLIRFELMAVVRYRSSDYHCCLLQETFQFDNIRLALAVRALSRVAVDQHEQYSHLELATEDPS